jgi:Xaa-Pro aminopeptidase
MFKLETFQRKLRLNKLEEYLKKQNADYFLTSLEHEIYYFTGAYVEGYFLFGKNYDLLFTSPLYYEDAFRQSLAAETICSKKDFSNEFRKILRSIPAGKILVSNQERLGTYLVVKRTGHRIKVAATQSLRAIKDDREIESIKKAYEIIEKAILEALSVVKEGISELDLKAEISYRARRAGAETDSFEYIVVFGEKSSVPHAKTGLRKLKSGDLILIDAGVKYGGYCSDITRCFFFGKNNDEISKYYRFLRQAQEIAIEALKEGIKLKNADHAVREFFQKLNLEKNFTHSLGHGIGLEIHESPYLSQKSTDILQAGMVFTIEPGLYFDGKYGLRLEDGYYFFEKPLKLSKLSPELIII